MHYLATQEFEKLFPIIQGNNKQKALEAMSIIKSNQESLKIEKDFCKKLIKTISQAHYAEEIKNIYADNLIIAMIQFGINTQAEMEYTAEVKLHNLNPIQESGVLYIKAECIALCGAIDHIDSLLS
jgi:hypothetical protein